MLGSPHTKILKGDCGTATDDDIVKELPLNKQEKGEMICK